MDEEVVGLVNALLRAMGISAHLRSTEDVQHACSRTSLFVALCEAVLGVPVPQAVRETRSCLDIQQNIQAVLDQLGGLIGTPLSHISPEEIVERGSIRDIHMLVSIIHSAYSRRSRRASPQITPDASNLSLSQSQELGPRLWPQPSPSSPLHDSHIPDSPPRTHHVTRASQQDMERSPPTPPRHRVHPASSSPSRGESPRLQSTPHGWRSGATGEPALDLSGQQPRLGATSAEAAASGDGTRGLRWRSTEDAWASNALVGPEGRAPVTACKSGSVSEGGPESQDSETRRLREDDLARGPGGARGWRRNDRSCAATSAEGPGAGASSAAGGRVAGEGDVGEPSDAPAWPAFTTSAGQASTGSAGQLLTNSAGPVAFANTAKLPAQGSQILPQSTGGVGRRVLSSDSSASEVSTESDMDRNEFQEPPRSTPSFDPPTVPEAWEHSRQGEPHSESSPWDTRSSNGGPTSQSRSSGSRKDAFALPRELSLALAGPGALGTHPGGAAGAGAVSDRATPAASDGDRGQGAERPRAPHRRGSTDRAPQPVDRRGVDPREWRAADIDVPSDSYAGDVSAGPEGPERWRGRSTLPRSAAAAESDSARASSDTGGVPGMSGPSAEGASLRQDSDSSTTEGDSPVSASPSVSGQVKAPGRAGADEASPGAGATVAAAPAPPGPAARGKERKGASSSPVKPARTQRWVPALSRAPWVAPAGLYRAGGYSPGQGASPGRRGDRARVSGGGTRRDASPGEESWASSGSGGAEGDGSGEGAEGLKSTPGLRIAGRRLRTREEWARRGEALRLLAEVKRRYEAAVGAGIGHAHYHNDSKAMRRAAQALHLAPSRAFDPEPPSWGGPPQRAPGTPPLDARAARRRGRSAKRAADREPRTEADATAAAAARSVGAEEDAWLVGGLVRLSSSLGLSLPPSLAARVVGLERMRARGDDLARHRREAAAAERELRGVGTLKRHWERVMGARERRVRLMDARKQVLALQRARHVAQAERARRAREQDEGARRVLSLRQRLAGEEAQGMREMFVEALAGAKELLIRDRLETRRRIQQRAAADEEQRHRAREVLSALLDALRGRVDEALAESGEHAAEAKRDLALAQREREEAYLHERRVQGTWVRSRMEHRHYTDSARARPATADAVRRLVAA